MVFGGCCKDLCLLVLRRLVLIEWHGEGLCWRLLGSFNSSPTDENFCFLTESKPQLRVLRRQL